MINLKQTFDTIQRSYADFFPSSWATRIEQMESYPELDAHVDGSSKMYKIY
jgi:hypothetical protein